MKKLKFSLLSSINILLGTLIAFLGVGCKHNKNVAKDKKAVDAEKAVIAQSDKAMVCMYGVPQAEIVVTGVVRDNQGRPFEGAIVEAEANGNHLYSTQTDSVGRFTIIRNAFPINEITITVKDKSGKCEPITKVLPLQYEGGTSQWNQGQAVMQADFMLVPRRIERPLKYGIPYREKPDTIAQ